MAEYIDRQAATAYAPLPRELREYQTANLDDAFEYGYDFAIGQIDAIPAADVRPVVRGKWEKVGEQMLINLENAREQYAELGYPHRKILNLRCSSCRKVTMVDSSIAYDFCPHCGANMREES